MKRLDWKYLPIVALFTLSTALAPVFRAQDGSTVTRIRTDPPDAFYTVDGTSYSTTSGAVWPAGSKHVLNAVSPQNPPGKLKVRYIWKEWDFGTDGQIKFNPATVTASPSIPEFLAKFDVAYALTLVYFDCPDPTNCGSPGVIYVNDTAVTSSQDVYFAAGAQVTLLAIPNPGWVFVGWGTATNDQIITGFQNKLTLNAPMEVYPKFQPARKITLQSDPAGLQVLADRAPVFTPVTLDWGMSTVHSLGPVTPQQDRLGKWWAFQSWSDQGAANHAYQVGSANNASTVTATYVPAAPVSLFTKPLGLPLKVDGALTTLTPQNPYYFNWGVGEKHHIEAPTQQTDAQGRVWKFTSWSNGAAAVQDIMVPLDADVTGGMSLTATYSQLGKLTVNSALSPLSVKIDGVDCPTPCEVLRDLGTKVRVSTPGSIPLSDTSRLDFNGWPGGSTDYTVTLAENAQTVNATYRTMNRFSAASDPPNGANWRVDPVSSDNFYSTDAMVAVSLSTQPGFRFRRWEGDLSGTIPSGTVAMSAPRAVRALLDAIPYIAPTGVGNAAGTTPSTAVAPGSIVSIFGANMANATAVAGDGMLSQTLAGVTVRVGDRLLPLVFASPTQINAVLPSDLAEGQQILTVSPPAQPDVRTVFTVARNAPGIFGTVIHEDGSAVTADAPARSGELLTVYGTGFGPVDHTRLDGFPVPASPDYLEVDAVAGQVGDTAVQVVKAFAAPGKVGIDAVQFRLGDGSVSGPLKITMNGVDSNPVTLPVQ
ncbi:MAG TPA: hypothetical protein VNV86_01855 [Candidatus Acidoferrum sp.]|nr:hypothetical protein [Candidatus Acidoferrum sp.]